MKIREGIVVREAGWIHPVYTYILIDLFIFRLRAVLLVLKRQLRL